jgi:hypothetical protein
MTQSDNFEEELPKEVTGTGEPLVACRMALIHRLGDVFPQVIQWRIRQREHSATRIHCRL